MNGMVAATLILGRRVTQDELRAQFLGDAGVDIIHAVLLLDLEVSAAGLLRNPLQDLLAIRTVLLLGIPAPSRVAPAGIAAPRIPPTRIAPPPSPVVERAVVVILVAAVVDGVDDRLRPLRRFDRAVERLLAAPILSVRQDHNRFPPGLLLHHLIAGEEDCIVEQRARPMAPMGPSRVLIAGWRGLNRGRGIG